MAYKRFLASFDILLVVAICHGSATAQVHSRVDVFPLNIGNKWSYRYFFLVVD
jgi:hypothetical protein